MQRPMSLEICSSVALRRLPSLPVKLGSLLVLRTRANFCLEFEFESCAMSSQYAYPGVHTCSCSAGALMSTDRSRENLFMLATLAKDFSWDGVVSQVH